MTFNRIDFGNNIKTIRKQKGLSQENLAYALNKNVSTIARFESGELLPNAEEISKICDLLEVEEYQLFNSQRKLSNLEDSKNPFDTDTLYLYYNAYFNNLNKYMPTSFILKLYKQGNNIKVEMKDFNTSTIYLTGFLISDDNVAICILENYKPLYPRLEIAELIINISNGTNRLMPASYTGTDKNYISSIRKSIVSKEIIPDEKEEEVRKLLTIEESDKETLEKNDVLYLHSNLKTEFEENNSK